MMEDYPMITAADVKGGKLEAWDVLDARVYAMEANMMTNALLEEAIEVAWEDRWAATKWQRPGASEEVPPVHWDFDKGFRSGVAFALRQAKKQTSSQTVGNISQYPAAVEEPEEEV